MSSMASTLEDSEINLDNFLRCKLCEKYLRDPKILPCLHSFCECCLSQYTENNPAEDGKIQCPECKGDVGNIKGGIAALPANTLAVNLQKNGHSQNSSDNICDNCRLDSLVEHADVKCLDCHEYLCGECLNAHKRIRLTRDHNVVNVADIQSGKVEDEIQSGPVSMCEQHKEPIKMFCGKCTMALCVVCYATEHNTHPCKQITDVLTDSMQAVQKCLGGVKDRVEGTSEAILVLDRYENDFEKKVALAQKGIDDRKAQLSQLINKFSEMQLEKLQDLYDKEQLYIQQKRNRLNQHANALEMACHFAENLMKYGKGGDNMILAKQVQSRLESLGSKSVSEKLDRATTVTFSVPDGVNSIDQLFGCIKTSASAKPKSGRSVPPATPRTPRRSLPRDPKSSSDQELKESKNTKNFTRAGSLRSKSTGAAKTDQMKANVTVPE